MKRTSRRAAAAVIGACATAGLLAACGSSSSSSGTTATSARNADSSGITMGFAGYATASDPVSQAWLAGMTCFADQHGDTIKTAYASVDLNKQITDVETLLAQGVKGIFIYPLDTKALTPAIQKAAKQGAAVISMNGPAPHAVDFEPNAARQKLGDVVPIIRTVIPSGGNAVIVGGPPQALAVQQQIKGFTDAAKKAGIEVLGRIDNPGKNITSQAEMGQIVGGQLLTKYPDANIIYTLTSAAKAG